MAYSLSVYGYCSISCATPHESIRLLLETSKGLAWDLYWAVHTTVTPVMFELQLRHVSGNYCLQYNLLCEF